MKKWGFSIGLTLVLCTGCFSAPQAQPQPSSTTVKTVDKASESGKVSEVGTTKPAEKPQASAPLSAAKQPAAQPVSGAAQPAHEVATGAADQAKSPEQIEGKYVSQLSQLEGYYEGQLEALRNEAVAARQKGESKASIYNRYADKANDQQEDSQAKVNALLFELKNELKAQHFPVDRVNTLRQSYYDKIDSAKNQLLQKLKE